MGILQAGPTSAAFDAVIIIKVDINDTQTYPSSTQVISNMKITTNSAPADNDDNGSPIGLIVSYDYFAAFSVQEELSIIRFNYQDSTAGSIYTLQTSGGGYFQPREMLYLE